MAEWYRNSYRRTLLDMHIEDWNEEFLSKYNPENYFEALKRAHIQTPMIYVQSHVGLCYWPTKSGVMHRAFIGKEDQVKRLFDLCHREGMPVILYYSIIFNNKEYDRHPEWRMLDCHGLGSREHGVRYGLLCPNNADYQMFVRQQIREFSDYFDFEGVFFDMTFWPEVCYCESCRRRFRKEYGGEMPQIVDWTASDWIALQDLRQKWLGEFAQMVTDEAKRCKPNVTVEHQYSASMHYWRFGNNDNIAQASDYIGTDLYGGIRQQSFACKAWYHLTNNQPFQYMTSRCYPALTEHTTNKSYDQLKQCVAMTYLHHGASFLIDAIDPSGTIDNRVYDQFGKIYQEMMKYEPYMDKGVLSYDVALYFNMNGKMNVNVNGLHIMDHKIDRGNHAAGTIPHMDAMMGAQAALIEHSITYGVINQWKREEMHRHPVLVLSDVPNMSAVELEEVKKYIKNGGNVYMSGCSAAGLWEEILGIRMEGYTEETVTYMSPTMDCTYMQEHFTPEYPPVMFEKAVRVSKTVKGRVLAVLTLPYTIPVSYGDICPTEIKEEEYVEKDSKSYRFASIHANPPGMKTNEPALIETTYGKGRVIWSALPIERAERYQHRDIFANIINDLLGNNISFKMDAEEYVEGIVFREENGNCLIGMIDTRSEFHLSTYYNMKISIKLEKQPIKVTLLPEANEMEFTFENGWIEISVDQLQIFKLIAVYVI